jgi:hypothetical protein
VETCFGVLSTLRANRVKPGVGVLCNLLQVCARNDTSARVLDIWALVEAEKLRMTPHVLSAALACCAKCVRECPDVAKLALRLEKQLQERWMDASLWHRCTTTEANFRVAFNSLLAYHAAAQWFDHGLETWQVCARLPLNASLSQDLCMPMVLRLHGAEYPLFHDYLLQDLR